MPRLRKDHAQILLGHGGRNTVVENHPIIKAIGEELARARKRCGWTRPEMIKHMQTKIPVNTYACYEQGIRQCSIPLLIEICETLGTSLTTVLDTVLECSTTTTVDQIASKLMKLAAGLYKIADEK